MVPGIRPGESAGAGMAAQRPTTPEQQRQPPSLAERVKAKFAGPSEARLAEQGRQSPAHAAEILTLFAGKHVQMVVAGRLNEIQDSVQTGRLTESKAKSRSNEERKLYVRAQGLAQQTDEKIRALKGSDNQQDKELGYDMDRGFLRMRQAEIQQQLQEITLSLTNDPANQELLKSQKTLKEMSQKVTGEIAGLDKEMSAAGLDPAAEGPVTALAATIKGGTLTPEEKKNPMAVIESAIGGSLGSAKAINAKTKELVSKGIISAAEAEQFKENVLIEGPSTTDRVSRFGLNIMGLLALFAYIASQRDKQQAMAGH
ncbi:hypothetical protein HY214_03150 [Candidatus Roizmanbacteria bacterium]|nr:hypothetical protein [Candidatus Roizmanbacteria bacterium]